jgi:hypothetical protein
MTGYRERKEWADWPRKEPIDFLLIEPQAFTYCGQRGHQKLFEKGAPEQVEGQKCLPPFQDVDKSTAAK